MIELIISSILINASLFSYSATYGGTIHTMGLVMRINESPKGVPVNMMM